MDPPSFLVTIFYGYVSNQMLTISKLSIKVHVHTGITNHIMDN